MQNTPRRKVLHSPGAGTYTGAKGGSSDRSNEMRTTSPTTASRTEGCPDRVILFSVPIICQIWAKVYFQLWWSEPKPVLLKWNAVMHWCEGRHFNSLPIHLLISFTFLCFILFGCLSVWLWPSQNPADAPQREFCLGSISVWRSPPRCRGLPVCRQRHQLSSPLLACHGWGQSKGRAETKGLLKFKRPGCCEDIFYLFWHLHCQQEWQRVHHSPAFSRAEGNGNLEGFSWGIQSRRATAFDGLMANVNEQAGQGLPRGSLKDTKTLSLLMSQGGLFRETLRHVVRASKQESVLDLPAENELSKRQLGL